MSSVLQQLSGKTATQILERADQNNITVDIFAVAEEWGIKWRPYDFSDIETDAGIKEGTVLGAIIDDNEADALMILLKDRLSESSFYDGKTQGEKMDILRRRQRFTLAHEIAHACLHLQDQEVKLRVDYNRELDEYIRDNSDDEYRANVFAGELLLPSESLIRVLGQIKYPTVENFSKVFDVSKTVVRERLKYLGLHSLIESME